MAFTKAFPKRTDKLSIPTWVDITLSEDEEKQVDEKARQENIRLMKECIDDAKRIFIDKNMREYQTNIVNIAIALFEKRASHSVYWKESRAKEKI
ncbi:hypothetical protein JXA85_07340 [Candidatus Woesearchaeota archaeon]|nr:hypothetical protein [Candidatus Woesearchaeota archaeon]